VGEKEADVWRVNLHEVGEVGRIDLHEESLRVLFGEGVFASGEYALLRIQGGSHACVSFAGKLPAF
jgi:hypothetical protein